MIITLLDVSRGGVDKIVRNNPSTSDREKEFKKAMNENEFKLVKLRKGMTKESFLHEQPWPWMVKRIESLCNTNFEHVMRKGVPDFCVAHSKGHRLSFVEVKGPEGGLRDSQLQWLRLFDDVPYKIAYVEEWKDVENEVKN
jgi:hypothetical protein